MSTATAQEDVYFVRLAEPVSIRRALLTANKDLLVALSKYERFRILRKKRHEATAELKKDCKDVNELLSKLRGLLPKLSTSLMDKKIKPRPMAKKQIEPKMNSELDKIEHKIKSIEDRLSKLD